MGDPRRLANADEPPLATVRREVEEELGLVLPIGRLLSVDWINRGPPRNEGLMFLFDGGLIDDPTAARIRLPADELSAFRFVDLAEAGSLLAAHMHQRIEATLRARQNGTTAYLEDGRHVLDR